MLRSSFSYYIILLLVLPVWVISCQTTPDSVIQSLSHVEECMEKYPDSALNLLNRIPYPEALRGKAQADYGLLMTQAMDKNYIKPESDSLISLALGYYSSHGEDVDAMGKAFFYYGRVMLEMNRQEDAMKYLLKAKEIFDGTKKYKMLALISQEIGNLNWNQDLSVEALNNFKDSRKYFILAKDTFGLSYALRNIGRTYLSIPNTPDSISYSYYLQALQIAHEKHCSSEFIILQELGVMHRARKQYKKAEFYLLQALRIDIDNPSIYEAYLSLGYLYLLMDSQNEAEKYLKLSINASNLYTQVGAYNTLFWLEKTKKNPWLAIQYKEKADSLNDLVNNREVMERVADLQKKYDREKLQKENLQIKVRYQFFGLCALVLLLIAVFVGCYYYYKNRANKRRIYEIEQEIKTNEEEIVLCQQKIAEHEQSHHKSIDYQAKIGELTGKVLLLTQQNKKLTVQLENLGGDVSEENIRVDRRVTAFRSLIFLKDCISQRKLTSTDWNYLFEFFNLVQRGLATRLQADFPRITKHELALFCLLRCGFTNEEIAHIFLTNTDSVTKAKGRLKKRLDISPEDELESFVVNY